MALVNMNKMLTDARAGKYAVGAFDVSNLDMAMAVTEAAEEKKSPVILMGLAVDLVGDRLSYCSDICVELQKLHLFPWLFIWIMQWIFRSSSGALMEAFLR